MVCCLPHVNKFVFFGLLLLDERRFPIQSVTFVQQLSKTCYWTPSRLILNCMFFHLPYNGPVKELCVCPLWTVQSIVSYEFVLPHWHWAEVDSKSHEKELSKKDVFCLLIVVVVGWIHFGLKISRINNTYFFAYFDPQNTVKLVLKFKNNACVRLRL